MKKQWMLWFLVVVLIAGVFFVFNYQGNKDFMPLKNIFPEQASRQNPAVEYVFMDAQSIDRDEVNQKEIAPVGMETIDNEVDSLPQGIEAKPETNADIKSAAFTIQVASFQEEKYAQSALEKLITAGHPGRVVTKDLGDKGVWHRVYVGAFQNKSEAQDYLEKIKEKYADSLIVAPR